MKLLIVTQTLDKQDPILGFFHRWVEEFAKNCEVVHVLALNVGEYELPENVKVYCLGKSEGKPKIVWLWRLWKISWQKRHDYDNVFVHMNPEYVLYGAAVWKLLRKNTGLWYAHGSVSLVLRVSCFLVNKVFTSTSRGFALKSRKVSIVGQGIDTKKFSPSNYEAEEVRLLSIGRISKAKGLDVIIKAFSKVVKKYPDAKLELVGSSLTDDDFSYKKFLDELLDEYNLQKKVIFTGGVSQDEVPYIINKSSIFVQNGKTGSLDKALLEAVSCGIITISSNESYSEFVNNNINFTFEVDNVDDLSQKIIYAIEHRERLEMEIKKYRNVVSEEHGLLNLVIKIVENEKFQS